MIERKLLTLERRENGPDSTQQLPSVVSLARSCEGAEPLMSMRWQNGCARPDDFTPFVPGVSRSADRIHAPMSRWQLCRLRQCPLSSSLSRCIYIKDQPPLSTPIPQSSCCFPLRDQRPGNKILLKDGT